MTKFAPLLILSTLLVSGAQVTIIDSGSTNFPGMTVRMEKTGHQAMVEQRSGAKQRVKLTKEMCDDIMKHLKAAGPLNALPERHCMKSASFGSSLYVESNGLRSPDLSCPGQDERVERLKKDAEAILSAAKGQMKSDMIGIR